jgi:hypothetical protein
MVSKEEGVAIAVVTAAAAAVGGLYLASKAKAAVPVSAIAISVTPNPDTVDEAAAVTATATDGAESPVSGAPLYLFVDGTLQSPSEVTNSSGVATFSVVPQTAGTYTILVSSDSEGT